LVLGTFTAVARTGTLGVLAGVMALVAGATAFLLVRELRRAGSQITELAEKVHTLETEVERAAEAKAEMETLLANRIQLTAMRRGTEADKLTDPGTGLYSEGYFTVALDARIASARRNLKPVAVVLIEVVEGLLGSATRPAEPAVVAKAILGTVRESDTACRLLDGGYALVLEDTSENGAIWTVERIRRAIAANDPDLTLWAGVACYPAHGFSTEDILDRADLALDMAREWRQDRIEVATAD
jgi:two-component system cell cycle response regulator